MSSTKIRTAVNALCMLLFTAGLIAFGAAMIGRLS